jgi:hypothetical protein
VCVTNDKIRLSDGSHVRVGCRRLFCLEPSAARESVTTMKEIGSR